MAKNLAERRSAVLWKAELASSNTGYSAEEISKWSSAGVASVLLDVYRKMQERDGLKTESLSKREPELKNLENSQLIYIAKNKDGLLKRALRM